MSLADLRKLPLSEELKPLEALLSDFAADEKSFENPPWQADELRRTEVDFAAGLIELLDWEDAKTELRQQFE